MNTTTLKFSDVKHNWHLVDIDGQILGRVAVQIAKLLTGKGKALTGDHLDNGDFVVAINAAKFKVTGKKMADKMYYSHSGFPGGFKEITLAQLAEKDARRVIEKAVKGMLPKNKLQQTRLRRLKLYLDDKHPYAVELGLKTKNQELTTKN
ncbi:MAG: 50S ribosomal protein L13 [Candidatus Collierbacteria bacterium GW2011_GWB1_45_35]|uniref:Large ribosomal subunit protein uL13 n=1 Tax=Candidatus Collierbacteria bacterium GW2011_GWB2_45_17 TaxID=1618388 RepID=A0A837IMB5_9BACT|nr:MAG: 50S ribosomal protein L13 [Microgenomates group bacterium GW2011_GWC1_44_23]KKT96201.1 MAG: 50S ribosomal protein L13 [Candidatus Collierbacteria bacterium GW2011_GWA1_45_15]KKU01241.1 MAG: 50S ribosomal protein L13 [Candidatus Collierbacteria bacterium GW2011_GWB2_45_17]KKU05332.1 MAG: 50S ribosomal protein L13 [Candidatus Collierbacteria bacterium GW2011_GWB1_45_35]KKU08479.1 MAG: 50S ribosomal protein L13 [Candidatus Collierbacteria bacterium GW2011_GWC2_45_40]HBC45035.1 50S ribosom